MHQLLPITLAIVHAHELMRMGIKAWCEQAGLKVVLEQECPKGLLKALPPEGVHVLLLYVGITLQLALDTADAVRRRYAHTAVLLVGEWTEGMVERTVEVEVQGLLDTNMRTEELARAVQVAAHGGMHLNKPTRQRLNIVTQEPAKRKGSIQLTGREEKILAMMSREDQPTYQKIADELHRKLRTVWFHRDNLFLKFGVHTRGQLKDAAREKGFLPPLKGS